MTMYTSTELSGKRKGEGVTSPPDREEAALIIIMYMATLGMGDNSRVGKKVLHRVEIQWGRQFQSSKKRKHHPSLTNKRMTETEAFEE